jgi:hypothetical protein
MNSPLPQTSLLNLDRATALVLFELLSSREDEIVSTLRLQVPERNAIWSVVTALEKVLVEPFSPDYAEHLAAARKTLLETGGE